MPVEIIITIQSIKQLDNIPLTCSYTRTN